MEKEFKLEKTFAINADIPTVWDALTNPAIIKQYFFGTETISEWKEGSPIIFQGEWEGQTYVDRGTILKIEPPTFLHFTYWSSLSGTEDKPENYANVTYALASGNGHTLLTITQDGIATREAQEHSEQNWQLVIDGLKKLVESRTGIYA